MFLVHMKVEQGSDWVGSNLDIISNRSISILFVGTLIQEGISILRAVMDFDGIKRT